MRKVNGLILFILTLAFFASNVGLSVYTHVCQMDGVKTSFFIQGEDPCEKEHIAKLNTPTHGCCADKVQEDSHGGCCSTDAQYIVNDHDLTNQSIDLSIPFLGTLAVEPIIWSGFSFNVVQKDYPSDYFRNPPPKYQGRSYFPLHQVYII